RGRVFLESHAHRKTVRTRDLIRVFVGRLSEVRIELEVRSHRGAIGGRRSLRALGRSIGERIERLQRRAVEVREDALLHDVARRGGRLFDTLLVEQIDDVALEEEAYAADWHAPVGCRRRLENVVE